jgi:hypothetical protein
VAKSGVIDVRVSGRGNSEPTRIKDRRSVSTIGSEMTAGFRKARFASKWFLPSSLLFQYIVVVLSVEDRDAHKTSKIEDISGVIHSPFVTIASAS